MDHISIKDLEVFANHGVFEEEVNLGQKFLVCADLYFDISDAGRSDDLHRSVDYAEVCASITKWMKKNRCRLIETVACRLADKLLSDNEVVREVEVTIKKPWAPIGLPLECVSITVSRKWHRVYLSLGSNMGDRKKYIEDGIKFIKKKAGIRVLSVSKLIETKPYGKTDQDDFLNGAAVLETILRPYELLALLRDAEKAAGRVKKEHWGPRTLDMDILMYDDLIMAEDELVIPHYDMAARNFVLAPLSEIAPYAVHPVTRKTVAQMYSELKASGSEPG
ncbi:MAG: 2-amino-4-hydroxy-6-hydroxymethyldihydropteridine diphosphokinase [Lachnospiraceae bacterium]|nr:2-amino-4-hydroxy-6-hydroxymethyldihydropteridine diphosphokinase [Lachnospiraceae bacterium]